MKKFIWRVHFTLAVMWIFRDHKGCQLKLGWKTSKTTVYKSFPPYEAALEEISEWYS